MYMAVFLPLLSLWTFIFLFLCLHSRAHKALACMSFTTLSCPLSPRPSLLSFSCVSLFLFLRVHPNYFSRLHVLLALSFEHELSDRGYLCSFHLQLTYCRTLDIICLGFFPIHVYIRAVSYSVILTAATTYTNSLIFLGNW